MEKKNENETEKEKKGKVMHPALNHIRYLLFLFISFSVCPAFYTIQAYRTFSNSTPLLEVENKINLLKMNGRFACHRNTQKTLLNFAHRRDQRRWEGRGEEEKV